MKKRITLTMLVIIIIVSMSSLSVPQNVYATNTYKTSAALKYASEHWNDGVGKCAQFVSECIKAGGCSAYSVSASALFAQLRNSGMGTVYEITLGSDGSIYMPGYSGKIQAGDPIFYYCSGCTDGKPYIHTVLCNGADANGYMKAYSHNKANSGNSKYTYSSNCYECIEKGKKGTVRKAYVYHFNSDHSPIGHIDSISGGEQSIHLCGWAFDEDIPSKQLIIHVYVGGPAGSPNAVGFKITANKERQDVHAAYGVGNYHGFDDDIFVNKTGRQDVYIYAINANPDNPDNNNKLLGSYSVFIKKENKINFPTRTVTLNEGETKTFSFTFQGDGIHALSMDWSNGNINAKWGVSDWTIPKASISLQGLKEGTASLNVWFQDSNGKNYFKDTITVKVNHVHKYSIAKVTKKPTCTSNGTKGYVCSCGAVSATTESIPAVGHTVVTDSAVAATCTKNGKTAGKHCSVCKAVIVQQKTITATGHKGGTATCTSRAKCSTCGESYGNYGNHKYGTEWTIDKTASCVTEGSKSHHCKYCDAKKDTTSIPAIGHLWDKGTVLRQATETITGLKSYTCYNCGVTKTETLPTIEKEDEVTLVREITLNHTIAKLSCGDTLQLIASIAPANADNKAVIWTSSDEDIIEVSSTGLVKAVSSGGAMIFCTAIDGSGVRSSCSITVLSNDIPDVPVPPSEPELSDDSEEDEEEDDYEDEELEEGDMLTDSESNADYEIIDLENGTGTVKYLSPNANSQIIKIPETVTVYGVTYKVTSIGEGAFEDNKNVTRIIMGSNITNIEKNAFKGCSYLTSVIIGNNVTQIGNKAFYKCKNLTKITIPSKINKIGKQAFYGCKRLKKITIKTTKLTNKRIGSKAFKGTYERAMVKVPKSKLKIYQTILKEKGISKKAKIRK